MALMQQCTALYSMKGDLLKWHFLLTRLNLLLCS